MDVTRQPRHRRAVGRRHVVQPELWPPVVVVVLPVVSWLDVSNLLTDVAAVAGAATVRAWWRRRQRGASVAVRDAP
jgi:hypothetical protein